MMYWSVVSLALLSATPIDGTLRSMLDPEEPSVSTDVNPCAAHGTDLLDEVRTRLQSEGVDFQTDGLLPWHPAGGGPWIALMAGIAVDADGTMLALSLAAACDPNTTYYCPLPHPNGIGMTLNPNTCLPIE